MTEEVGIEGCKWIDWFREHPMDDDLKLQRWSDEQCGGPARVEWRHFSHPQPALREREAARFPGWINQIALSPPKLELLRTEARALGPDTWRVRLAVANSGYLPAYITKRALEHKVVCGSGRAQLATPPGQQAQHAAQQQGPGLGLGHGRHADHAVDVEA